MNKLAVVLASTVVGTGLLADDAFAGGDPACKPLPEMRVAGGRGHVDAPPAEFVESHGPISHIIYLNRCVGGCTFTQTNVNDALHNRTNVSNFVLDGEFHVSEFAHSDAMWNATVQCVREAYAPFNVDVVTEDPGEMVPHHEAVVAGNSQELCLPDDVGGRALSYCTPTNNVISFSLANSHTPDFVQLCATIAQESGHSFTLDHAFECTDAMTYLTGCGQKFFRNKNLRCGEFDGARPCRCQRVTQNSHATLLAIHGPNATPIPAPTVDIIGPAPGSIVSGAFSVTVTAHDIRGVDRLELLVNGWKWNQVPGTRPDVEVPAALPNGVMDVTIKACNDLDRCSEDTVTVIKGAPCVSADSCLLGQTCEAGKCFWEPPTGQIGDDCSYPQQCLSETCVELSSGGQICSQNCVGGPNDVCPAGFACSGAVGVAGVCAPVGDGGGCCSTSESRGPMLANIGLGTLVGLIVARRRRRRAVAR